MSTEPAIPSDRREQSTGRLVLGGVFGVFSFLVLILISPAVAEQVLLGWIYFPVTVLPRVTVDVPSVVVGAAASVLFLISLHLTLRWFARSRPWPIRRSMALGATVAILFAAGTAAVGATHQVIWLLTDGGPSPAGTKTVGLLSAVQSARDAAWQSTYRYDLKYIGQAFHGVHDSSEMLPPGGTITLQGRLMHGWAICLAGYLSFSNHGIDFTKPWSEAPNAHRYRCAIPEFQHPSVSERFDKDGYGYAHLAGNQHVLPLVQTDEPLNPYAKSETLKGKVYSLKDITDGVSETLLIGEVAHRFRPWGHPCNLRDPVPGIGKSPEGFDGQPQVAGAMFLFVDGSVRSLSRQTDPSVTRALATPRGGEKGLPDL